MGTIPRIAGSVDELVAGAEGRRRVDAPDGKSGSTFERLTIDGRPYFLKRLSPASDWIMRITGDHDHRPFRIWQAGLMDRAPEVIDHTLVGMAIDGTGDDAVLSMLMHDVGEHLIPEGDDPLTAEQHEGFMAALAALSVALWEWDDDLGLTPLAHRFRFFCPDNIAAELERDDVAGPITAAELGWSRLRERSPAMHRVVTAVHERAEVLARALQASTPMCFLQGDWKAGNLGRHPDGRTILIDWAYPGSGPCCYDLGWYLALNRARLPEPKETAIERFRDELERGGVEPAGWFDLQLDLSLLGVAATFGWEKALGDDDELAWWADRAARGAARVPGLLD